MLPPLSKEQQIKPHRFELRMSLLYACLFLPNGIHLPYFPLWLEYHRFTPSEIASIIAIPYFVRIFAGPVVSAWADRARDRVPVLLACAILSLAACAGYLLPATYLVVLAVSIVLAIAWAPQTPLSDSITLSGVRRYGVNYASMRVWGSISFLIVNIVGGYILAAAGAGVVPLLMLAGFVTIVAATFIVPRLGKPRLAAPTPAQTIPQASFALRQPYFVLIIAAWALAQSSHAFAYAFSSIYWKTLGIDDGTIGLFWAFSVLAEVIMFFLCDRLFPRARPGVLLAVGTGLGVLRWILFPLIWPAGLGVAGFYAVQGMHAFSFSLAFLGGQKMFSETVPEERMGAAQGVAFFLIMGTLALLTLASGPLYEAFGVDGFYAMALVSGIGAILALRALAYPQSARSGG
jgi:PPP family 3-phenylpropionic acid transporter